MTRDDLINLLRQRCNEFAGQTIWAKFHNISPSYVSDVLKGRREPGQAILDALNLERVVSYKPKPPIR